MFLDVFFVVFLGVSFYWGYQKGIIYSIFSLLAYIIGVVFALKFSSFAVKIIHGALNTSHKTTAILAFLLVFIVVVLLVRFIAWGLEQILKSFSLNAVNQITGGAIHALIGIYIFCLFVWFLNKWKVLTDNEKAQSHVYKYVDSVAPDAMKMMGQVVPFIKTTFEEMETLVDENIQKNKEPSS